MVVNLLPTPGAGRWEETPLGARGSKAGASGRALRGKRKRKRNRKRRKKKKKKKRQKKKKKWLR